MSKCPKCGLFSAPENNCFWFKKELSPSDIEASSGCYYFIEIMYEDGDPLTPLQHLLFKKQDVASKKMQGPV